MGVSIDDANTDEILSPRIRTGEIHHFAKGFDLCRRVISGALYQQIRQDRHALSLVREHVNRYYQIEQTATNLFSPPVSFIHQHNVLERRVRR